MRGGFGMMIIPTILIALVVYVIYNPLQNNNVKDTLLKYYNILKGY